MNTNTFILSKFDNFYDWIVGCEILSGANKLSVELLNMKGDIDKILYMIKCLNHYANVEGDIKDTLFEYYLNTYNLKISDFLQDDVKKFKRYLKLFVLAYRS